MFKKYLLPTFILLLLSLSSSLVSAKEPEPDSLHNKTLKEITVSAKTLQIARAALPEQLKTEKEIGTLNATNVADVAKYFSGVTVKDYGGIGGIKTVSLRGLGSQHTGVSYDGVMMSDVQSGQIDLGRFSIENVSEVSLSMGQPNDIFQTARMFSTSGVLCLNTKLPDDDGNRTLTGKVTARTGSFGLANLGIFLAQNPGKKWAYNFLTDALAADGSYKFVQHYGSSNNLAETLNRSNSDIQSVRSEINVLYRMRERESISLKANYYLSERGLPAAITYYNSYNKQRLWDKTFFTQLHYENRISEKVQYQCIAKFNSAYNRYRDIDPKYPDGISMDSYLQREYYLSSTFLFHPLQSWLISASTDWWYNNLDINSLLNFKDFGYPTRHTGLANIASKYVTDRMTFGANVLYTLTREAVQSGAAAPDRSKLSPCVNVSYKLLSDKELRIRLFYKDIFRLPTFNDLYYQDMGNHNLRPENTNQYNVGFTYLETEIPHLAEFGISVDGYYNRVTDKIIAIPKDLFHWTMINKGKVDIKGLDVSLKLKMNVGKTDNLTITTNYTYQKAQDKTPASANFDEQIPYTPVNSGSASAAYRHGIWEFAYNIYFSGERWTGQNIEANRLDGYLIHSFIGSTYYKQWKLSAEVINLLDTQYEVIKFYPMPGRNFRITLSKKF